MPFFAPLADKLLRPRCALQRNNAGNVFRNRWAEDHNVQTKRAAMCGTGEFPNWECP
jgi:hypothetical protein